MSTYIIVEWPESQKFMGFPDFNAHSYLINDEKGVEIHGSSAYFIEKEWVDEVLCKITKNEEQMKYLQLKKECDKLIDTVAKVMQVSAEDIKGRSRIQWIAMAREIYCYYARKYGMSLTCIGRSINRDHTTVMHLLKAYERDLSLSMFSLASENVKFKLNDDTRR